MRNPRSVPRRLLAIFALPIVLIALWWALSLNSTSFFFPPLGDILGAFGPTWGPRFVDDVLPSIGRVLVGYLFAVVIGVLLGLLLGIWRGLRAFTEPPIAFLRSIPATMFIPIVMLFLGLGDNMKVVVIATGCVWPVLLNTIEGVRGVDSVLRDTAAGYRMRPWSRVTRLLLPAAGPAIMVGCRQALSVALILMVITERFAANSGIGLAIAEFERNFAMAAMWSGILLLGLIGVVLSLLFGAIESRLLSWYFGQRALQRGDR
ncbi:MAG: ABC transporter permease subunit [Candidatus Leucobacter sulfamidivorax]|nr:ABC transporter permease subunit [Candidatus Leucobacter sulfamidivorax]